MSAAAPMIASIGEAEPPTLPFGKPLPRLAPAPGAAAIATSPMKEAAAPPVTAALPASEAADRPVSAAAVEAPAAGERRHSSTDGDGRKQSCAAAGDDCRQTLGRGACRG